MKTMCGWAFFFLFPTRNCIWNRSASHYAQRLAVWLVADFEALTYQVTTTFDTGCAARISTEPAINYTAC